MSNLLNKNFVRLLVYPLTIVWGLWVLLEYVANHPYMSHALVEIPYLKMLLLLSLLPLAGIGFFYWKKKSIGAKEVKMKFRGGWLLLSVYLLSVVVLITYINLMNFPAKNFAKRITDFSLFSGQLLGAFFFIILTAQAVGAMLLKPLSGVYDRSIDILSIALGFSVLGIIAVLLGLFGLLNFAVMWAVMAFALLLGFRPALKYLKKLFIERQEVSITNWWQIPVFFILLLITAVNFIGAIKPYPIGYDGTYLYMNLSRLVSESHSLPAGGQAFNWSVVMSLGQVLFHSETVSIFLSHLMNVLCLFALFRVARLWLKPAYALLAICIPYISPFFGFHALVDEKVDLAFLFISISVVLLILEFIVKSAKKGAVLPEKITIFGGRLSVSTETYIWLIAGWLCGFAFGIKYTAIILVLALGSILFYQSGKKLAYAGYFLAATGLLFLLGIYQFGYIDISSFQSLVIGAALFLSGGGLLFLAFKENLQRIVRPLALMAGLGGMLFMAYLPWMLKHYHENQQISVQSLIQGKSAAPAIRIAPKYLGATQPIKKAKRELRKQFGFLKKMEKAADERTPKALLTSQQQGPEKEPDTKENNGANPRKNQLAKEEVRRYLGYESGLWLYTSLPYDLTMNTNIRFLRYLDIGFLFLMLFPLFLFTFRGTVKQLLTNTAVIAGLLVWLASCYYAIYFQSGNSAGTDKVMIERAEFFLKHPGGSNSWFYALYEALISPIVFLADGLSNLFRVGDPIGFGLILLILLAVFVAIYILIASKTAILSRSFKSLFGFLALFTFIWLILGNGIVWYAFPLWALLPIVLVYYFQRPERLWGIDYQDYTKHFFGVIFGLYILMNSLLYFTNPNVTGKNQALYSWQFVEYASDSHLNKAQAMRKFNPSFPEAVKQLNANPEDKIYRINTYLGYHIDKNDQRVYSDNVLGRFAEICSVVKEDSDFIDVLKDNGFRYILYDLSTPVIDQTAGQSLRETSNRLIRVLINSDKVELAVSDNYVIDEDAPMMTLPNGQRAKARPGIVGKVAYLGSYVLYKIL